jgi:hypothetical protein
MYYAREPRADRFAVLVNGNAENLSFAFWTRRESSKNLHTKTQSGLLGFFSAASFEIRHAQSSVPARSSLKFLSRLSTLEGFLVT